MKRENNFYFLFVLVVFISCFLTSYILSNRIIEFNGLLATASVIIYPLTYFILILFSERFDRNKALLLLNYSIIALVFTSFLITIASLFNVYQGPDGLEAIFNVNFRLLFASIISFYVGQILNLQIYYYLKNKKTFNFLISSVISITADSIILIAIGFSGISSTEEFMLLLTGQYGLSIVSILFYTICFGYLINTVIDTRKKVSRKTTKKKETNITTKKTTKKSSK